MEQWSNGNPILQHSIIPILQQEKYMAVFTYRAVDSTGQTKTGEIDADNEGMAVSRLQEMGLHVISLSTIQQKAKQAQAAPKLRRTKAKLEDLAMVSRQLAIMINSGVSILEALDAITIQIRDRSLKNVLADLQQQVLQGYSFSQALSRHPGVFSALYVDMVKTAEVGGELGRVMDQLATYLESNLDIVRKVKSAMMYPIIIVIASVITVIALVTFILPRFTKIFKDMGIELPATTKFLLAFSKFIINYWYIALAIIFVLYIGAKLAARTPHGRRFVDWSKLHFPLVGDLVRKVVLSRSLLALGTLLRVGVPLVSALDTAAGAAGNQVIASVYRYTRTSVESGTSIADSFKTSKEFPPLLIQMTAVGERTGALDDLLLKVSGFYEREADVKIKGLTSIIEPALIVVLGTLIGFIAVSIISPIYTLVGSIK